MSTEQHSGLLGNAGRANPQASQEGSLPSIWKWILVIAVIALIAWPIVRRLGGMGSDSAEAQLNKSLQLYQAGQYQDSIVAAQAALKAKPDYAPAYNNLAVANLQLKKYDEAAQNAEQALRLQPDFELAKNNLAWIQKEKAQATAPPPEPLKPGTAAYYVQQSLELNLAGKFQESIGAAEQALKLDPKDAKAYNNIAAAYGSLHAWDKEIVNAQKSIDLQPDFQLAKNNLAFALRSKADEATAKKK